MIRASIAAAYFLATGIGIYLFNGYIVEKNGIENIPKALYVPFGPLIAAANGHGVEIYIATTFVVLPSLILAASPKVSNRWIGSVVAVVVWCWVGYWMQS